MWRFLFLLALAGCASEAERGPGAGPACRYLGMCVRPAAVAQPIVVYNPVPVAPPIYAAPTITRCMWIGDIWTCR